MLRPPGESHAVSFHERARARIFRVEISAAYLERVREEARGAIQSPAHFDGGISACLALRLFKEFQRADSFSEMTIESLVIEIIAASSRAKDFASGRDPQLDRAIQTAMQNLNRPPAPPPRRPAYPTHP